MCIRRYQIWKKMMFDIINQLKLVLFALIYIYNNTANNILQACISAFCDSLPCYVTLCYTELSHEEGAEATV